MNPNLLDENEHYPFERFYFWKFLTSLIELAWKIFDLNKIEINSYQFSSDNMEIMQKQGILGNALSRLINEIIKPNTKQHVGKEQRILKEFAFFRNSTRD